VAAGGFVVTRQASFGRWLRIAFAESRCSEPILSVSVGPPQRPTPQQGRTFMGNNSRCMWRSPLRWLGGAAVLLALPLVSSAQLPERVTANPQPVADAPVQGQALTLSDCVGMALGQQPPLGAPPG